MLKPSLTSKLCHRLEEWKALTFYWLVIVLLSAMIATAADLWYTRAGAGASGDSVHYMQGADNILAGNGFSRLRADGQAIPITSFPPGYSIVLAGLGALGLPAFDAGRYLNAILFGINTALVGILIYRSTRSGLMSILGGWLFMYARNIFLIHTWVMSEPLFIFLALISALLLDLYLEHGKLITLILAGLLIGYASITRYLGLALIPALYLPALFLSKKKWGQRWRDVLISGVLSLTPLVAWFWRNSQVTGNLANRQFYYHPISKNLIVTFFNELSYWWIALSLRIPWKIRWTLLALFILVGVGIYLYRYTKINRSQEGSYFSSIPGFITIFAGFYSIILVLNTSLVDASTDEQTIQRYAIPLLTMGIIWTFSTYSLFAHSGWPKVTIQVLLVCIGLGTTLFYASKSVPLFIHPEFTFGYTDVRHTWTCEVNLLKSIDRNKEVITNDYELFYFLADRPAYLLTEEYDPSLGKVVEDHGLYKEGLVRMLRNGAILAALGNPDEYSNEVNALIGDLGLDITSSCNGLRLYVSPSHP